MGATKQNIAELRAIVEALVALEGEHGGVSFPSRRLLARAKAALAATKEDRTMTTQTKREVMRCPECLSQNIEQDKSEPEIWDCRDCAIFFDPSHPNNAACRATTTEERA